MDSQVGAILRQARNRREVELSEVEAATRIRARYLRAIEAEEWEALPGGVYTRGFIRAYASFLGLDGDRLADDYRAQVEGAAADGPTALPGPAAARGGGPAKRPRRRLGWLLAASAVVLLALLVVAILPGNEGGSGSGPGRSRPQGARDVTQRQTAERRTAPAGISVSLRANAEVWVCLLDARGQPLVDGLILEAGAAAGPFRSGSFTASFGNGEVSMMVDGSEAEIPATSSPIGYSIDPAGTLTELSEGERPTCT